MSCHRWGASPAEAEAECPPAPQPRRGNVLIETRVSLISTGTERMPPSVRAVAAWFQK